MILLLPVKYIADDRELIEINAWGYLVLSRFHCFTARDIDYLNTIDVGSSWPHLILIFFNTTISTTKFIASLPSPSTINTMQPILDLQPLLDLLIQQRIAWGDYHAAIHFMYSYL